MTSEKKPLAPAASPPGAPLPDMPPWAKLLAQWLDDFLRIPGTKMRFGLDSILGFFFPGAGDAMSAVGGVALLGLAFRMRVPGVVIARMVANVAVDALVGVVPFLGDLFDVAWKSNRKNLQLIERFQRPGAEAKPFDYVVVAAAVMAVLTLFAIPIVVAVYVVSRLFGS